jgi:hypothetical protein
MNQDHSTLAVLALSQAPVPAAVVLSDAPTLEQIQSLTSEILNLEAACHGVPLKHTDYLAPGIYVRELFIPKGTVLAGAKHKTDHLITFSGDITVWHEGSMVRLTGRHTLTSSAGAQRVGYAHADTWVACMLPNPDNETDVRVLEARFVEDSEQLQCNRMPVLPLPPEVLQ